MATYNLRRFAHADGLKAIAREHLLAILKPHKSYFDSRGLTLPSPSASDSLDYNQLVNADGGKWEKHTGTDWKRS
jgi:hypothetical protein